MAGGISLHAVDVASGRPALGMKAEVVALGVDAAHGGRVIAQGELGTSGALDHPVAKGEGVTLGTHEARFHVGEWLRASDPSTGPVFMEVAVFRFEVSRLDEHIHLPLKFTRWGFALFRGS
jgi:5-hydroxyisourate hydrolase